MPALDDERAKELVELSCEAVKRKSLSGDEGAMADLLTTAMWKHGFSSVEVDRYGNASGRLVFGNGGRRLLLEGHMDHVDAGDFLRWRYDPYGAHIEDGKIYGRGASDMKGNLCAMLLAASYLYSDAPDAFDGEVIVAGSVHEECFEGVAAEEIDYRWKPSAVVIGEASNLTVKRGQRGRAEVVVETLGKPAHSANPQLGVNAAKKMARLIVAIDEKFLPVRDAFLGDGILEITDMISSPYPGDSVVPEYCRATFDRRLLPGETHADVLDPIVAIMRGLAAVDPAFDARVVIAVAKDECYTGDTIEAERFAPGWCFPEDHPLVEAALRGVAAAGQKPEISRYSFCTNGSYYAGKAGIPTVGYGASLESLAHVTDEYIEIDALIDACSGYYHIIREVFAS